MYDIKFRRYIVFGWVTVMYLVLPIAVIHVVILDFMIFVYGILYEIHPGVLNCFKNSASFCLILKNFIYLCGS